MPQKLSDSELSKMFPTVFPPPKTNPNVRKPVNPDTIRKLDQIPGTPAEKARHMLTREKISAYIRKTKAENAKKKPGLFP